MGEQEYGSVFFARAVDAFAQLPGVGHRTAQRFALHLLDRPLSDQEKFVGALRDCLLELKRCPRCNAFSDSGSECEICSNPSRDGGLLCVVSDVRDVMALERAGVYRGLYFVLGGLIDPMAGRGPEQLPIESLLSTVAFQQPREVILAFSVNMEGDTTAFYLQKRLQSLNIMISAPARGIPFGERLDQADELTLNRALQSRTSLFTPVESECEVYVPQ